MYATQAIAAVNVFAGLEWLSPNLAQVQSSKNIGKNGLAQNWALSSWNIGKRLSPNLAQVQPSKNIGKNEWAQLSPSLSQLKHWKKWLSPNLALSSKSTSLGVPTFYGLLTQKAKSQYDYLFNPAVTTVSAAEVNAVSDTSDAPMTDATTDETPSIPMEISPTPFSHLVEEFVHLEASFEDPSRLSAPEIQPLDSSTEPLDTPAFDSSMLNHYHDLLHFLHDKLSEYFSSVQDPAKDQNFFLTLIIGPSDHINARLASISISLDVMSLRLKTVIRFSLSLAV